MAKDRQEEVGDLRRKLESVTNAYANTLDELDELKAEVEARERRLASLGNQPVQGDESFGDGDPVTAPSHYAGDGHTTCKAAMRSMADGYGYGGRFVVAYWCLNAFKYLWRWPNKDGLTDLMKARRCIDYAIEEYEHGDE